MAYPYDDPDAPDTSDMYGGYDTRGGSLDEIQQVLDIMARDPRVMAAARAGKRSNLESVLASYGLTLPRNHVITIGDDGRLTTREQGWWERSGPSVAILGGIGAAGAVPALMGGFGGGAGAAGAAGAGGVGIGETGAVTGLAGSGFGTGAGLGFSAVPLAGGTGGAAASTAAADGAGGVARRAAGGGIKDALIDLGLQGAGGLLQGLGESLFEQRRNSFSGTPGADPRELLSGATGRMSDLFDRMDAMPAPSTSAYAETPTGYVGGGLPMPIALSGRDPGVTRRQVEPPGDPMADRSELASALAILRGRR